MVSAYRADQASMQRWCVLRRREECCVQARGLSVCLCLCLCLCLYLCLCLRLRRPPPAANNCVSSIGPSVASLRLLRTLDVSNNQLNDLPAQLGEAVRLRELILYGNPLDNAPGCAKDANTGPLFEFLAAVNSASRSGKGQFSKHNLGAIPLQVTKESDIQCGKSRECILTSTQLLCSCWT